MYFSMHRYDYGKFWPNLRQSDFDYIGEGAGKGFNLNVPLNKVNYTRDVNRMKYMPEDLAFLIHSFFNYFSKAFNSRAINFEQIKKLIMKTKSRSFIVTQQNS